MCDKIAVGAFSRCGHLDNLDVVLSVPWRGGSRKSLAFYVDDGGGLISRRFTAYDIDEIQLSTRRWKK